ncbi:chromatin remodeling protein shl [Quercus suber]|uniref:Chromatin remodeling protein shl n=1 Tax=Quercus suber TaxID=58331 RepID=A0AAW0KG75_QUESU
MAKPKAPRRTLDSYTVKHINKTVKAGDCVLMRPSDPAKPSYVAKIERIEADGRGTNVKVHVRWYYRPEESIGGRRQFHGSKEVFLSDHYDLQSADTIEGKCTVHSFKSYTKLDAVGNDDFFCRFEYNSSTGAFNPDRVAVYCKCEMPYNPDDLMVQCEGCSFILRVSTCLRRKQKDLIISTVKIVPLKVRRSCRILIPLRDTWIQRWKQNGVGGDSVYKHMVEL